MTCGKSHFWRRFLCVLAAVFLLAADGLAETDPDPDSPVPVLISRNGSLRALAYRAGPTAEKTLIKGKMMRRPFDDAEAEAFEYGTQIALYVTVIELLEGEGANAFRVYIEDRTGRKYRFPVKKVDILYLNRSTLF